MIRTVRVFGILVLTIETTDEDQDRSPGSVITTPVSLGFVPSFDREDDDE